MAKYGDLIVFQKADELAFRIYGITDSFGLTSQLRRAALSVPTNIVEGYARKSKKELQQFVNIALASVAETEYLLNFSKRRDCLKTDISQVEDLLAEVGRLLWSFYLSVRESAEERK
jgi:four helix bundle protein